MGMYGADEDEDVSDLDKLAAPVKKIEVNNRGWLITWDEYEERFFLG